MNDKKRKEQKKFRSFMLNNLNASTKKNKMMTMINPLHPNK